MADFQVAISFVLENEKGLNENPHDRGGITNFGISLRFLKSISEEHLRLYGIYEVPFEQTIRDLTIDQAKKIYYGEFWAPGNFEKIINQEHANYIFDMAVNLGIATAIKLVQRACWAVQKDWEKLPDDGILGDQTIQAIRVCGFMSLPALRA